LEAEAETEMELFWGAEGRGETGEEGMEDRPEGWHCWVVCNVRDRGEI